MAIGAVRVGLAGPDGSIVAGSDRPVTFDGRTGGVIIPAGAPFYSDPVDLPVRPLERLLISIHVPGVVPRAGRSQFMYVSPTASGDQTAAPVRNPRLRNSSASVRSSALKA